MDDLPEDFRREIAGRRSLRLTAPLYESVRTEEIPVEYIAILLLAIGPNDVLAMPFPDVGPRSLSECQSIGFASYEYALSLDEDGDGFTTVVLPDGTKLQAEPVGWSCAPAEWYEGKGQE